MRKREYSSASKRTGGLVVLGAGLAALAWLTGVVFIPARTGEREARQVVADFLGVAPEEVGYRSRVERRRPFGYRTWVVKSMDQGSPWVEIGSPPDRLWVHTYSVRPENQVEGKLLQDEREAMEIAKWFVKRHWGIADLEVRRVYLSTNEHLPGATPFEFAEFSLWSEPRAGGPNDFYVAVKMSGGQVVTARAWQRQQKSYNAALAAPGPGSPSAPSTAPGTSPQRQEKESAPGADTPGASPQSAPKNRDIGPRGAEEAVRPFVQDDSVEVKCNGKSMWLRTECYGVKAGADSFVVDPTTGQVLYADFHGPYTDSVRLSLGEAEVIARKFLADHGMILTEQYRRIGAHLLDHGEGYKEYAFDWCKVVNEVWLPSGAGIRVRPDDGTVLGFSWRDVEVTVSTTPRISQEQAIAAARSALTDFDMVKGEVQRLSVTYNPKGNNKQVLVWVVYLEDRTRPAGPGGRFERTLTAHVGIDAHTGKVIFTVGSQK